MRQILEHHGEQILVPPSASDAGEWKQRCVTIAADRDVIHWLRTLNNKDKVICTEQDIELSDDCLESIRAARSAFYTKISRRIVKYLCRVVPKCQVCRLCIESSIC